MISYKEALNLMLMATNVAEEYFCPLDDTVNQICAETITSPIHVPPFTNSAMDGFAVSSQTLTSRNDETPISIPVIGSITAGMAGNNFSLNTCRQSKVAIEINTGAPLPNMFDSVIKLEDVSVKTNSANDRWITINSNIENNQNVRFKGEDINLQDIIIKQGSKITPAHIMALSAIGINKVKIYKLPKVAIIATGDELSNNNEESLMYGKIYNSNTPYIRAVCRQWQLPVVFQTKADDDESKFIKLLKQACAAIGPAGIIISTGAISRGTKDFIPAALQQIQANMIFHKIRIKPGKPVLFAKLQTGQYFFGLPGNPIAAAVGMRFIVYPFLRKLQKLPQETPAPALLTADFARKPGLTTFYKAKVAIDQNNKLGVNILSGQESFKIKPFAEANCWVCINEKVANMKTKDLAEVYMHEINNELFYANANI